MSDTASQPPEHASPPFRPVAELVHSLKFLTRLPVPFTRTVSPPPLHQTMRMFSLAGALIGLASGAFLLALSMLELPSLLAATLAVASTLLMTGALHEDGLADFFDGIGGGKSRERRLEIMRDSRIGTYGALALLIAILIRIFAYETFLLEDWPVLLAIMAASHSYSRGLVVDLMWATPPARSDGLSVLAGRPSRSVAMFAILVGLAITAATGFVVNPQAAVIALGAGLAATGGIRHLAMKLLGGQTGDVCGAAQVICELAMLMAFAATLG